MDIKITARNNKEYARSIAESWSKVERDRAALYLRLLLTNDADSAKVLILRNMLQLPYPVFKALKDEEISWLTGLLSWMKIEPTTTPIFPDFEHNGVKYHLPKADFLNGSAIEFAIADDYYNEFYADQSNPIHLIRLVATLAREARESVTDAVKFGDVRSPIHDLSDEAEVRANMLRDLPEEIIISVLMYFQGVKLMIHQMGVSSKLFDEPDKDELGNVIKEKDGALFGWRTIYRSVAKSGVFGNYEAVCQCKFFEIFSFLLEEKKASDDLEAKLNAQRNDK